MKMLKKVALAVAMITLNPAVWAKAPVWQVSHGENNLYIGGTVHVLAESDYPLPQAFDIAYEKADVVVFETDMSQMQSPDFQQKLIAEMLYHDGRTFADSLKPDTLAQLKNFLTAKNIPIESVQMFKPSMLAINLTMIELQSLGLAGVGVDEFYRLRGQKDSKSFLYLETPEQQLGYLVNMGEGNEDEMIKYTLKDINNLAESMSELKGAWRAGDNDKLYATGSKEMKEFFPDTYQKMIVERNDNWLPKLESYLQSAETEIVLVGALHLVGSDGVLTKLENKGYEVKQLQ